MLLALILLADCAPAPVSYERTNRYSAGPPGAFLQFNLRDPQAADDLMTQVQSTLLAHPEWVGQTQSHGVSPPSGYFYAYNGRCAVRPAAALAVEQLMKQAGAGAPRCKEVGY